MMDNDDLIKNYEDLLNAKKLDEKIIEKDKKDYVNFVKNNFNPLMSKTVFEVKKKESLLSKILNIL